MTIDENFNTPVAVSREDRVVRIALNRPEERNRLTPSMAAALLRAIGEAARDPSAGCIVLEQRGEVFCSGFDYDSLANANGEWLEAASRLFQLSRELRKPVVGAVQGGCAGAGVGLLLQCHFVIAAQGTKFAVNDVHSASWPALYWDSLAAAFGERRARELALTGRVFSAADAQAWGLVQELVPAFELEDRTLQMAAGLASLSPAAVSAGLEAASGALPASPQEWWRKLLDSPDFREALSAARERRKPCWPSLK
ncbi:MAG: enoyl-CoA hydratase/isomerase family protein [Bryobacteraceae bacterium]